MLAGCTIACSPSPSVSTKICRFLPLMSLPPSNPGGSIQAPFFGAFHALAVNDASAGTGFPFGFFPAFDVQRIIDAPQRAVVVFSLVPWRPVLENQVGREVRGLMRGGDISWELGRQRGIDIG